MSPVLPATWKLPETFHARLGEQAGRQRAMLAEGHLLIILHKIPEPGMTEREPLLFWRDPGGNWKTTGSGAGLAELTGHLNHLNGVADRLEEQLLQPANSSNYFDVLQKSGPLLRLARNMHRALQEAREAVPAERNLINARDRAGELERALELLHADAKNGLEYMIARRAEEQAKASQEIARAGHRLNLLIAIFLPITAIASIFGMNLRHGLEEITTPLLFWGVLIVGLALGWIVKVGVDSKREPQS